MPAPFAVNALGQEPWESRSASDARLRALETGAVGTPVGTVVAYYGTVSPTGWLLCNGATFSATTYPLLAALLGGTTLPNLKGRVLVGIDAAQTEFDVLGETGGAKTVALSTAELAVHGHTQNAHGHTQNSHGHVADDNLAGAQNTGTVSADHGHTVNAHNHGGGTGVHAHTVQGAWVDDSGADSGGGNNRARYAVGVNSNNPSTNSVGVGNTSESPGTAGMTANHTHSVAAHEHNISVDPSTATNNDATATNNNAGSGSAHNNLQPYCAINYIIRAA
jgi:microcystin-dependent protein